MTSAVSFTLNGKQARVSSDPGRMLLWVLRSDLGLTGAKYGCGGGFCGACTVLVDGEAVRSCATPLGDVAGKQVVTLEGLAKGKRLHALQQAFVDAHAFQCGFCTSGMILSAWALLKKNPAPTRAEIVRGLDDNLCRCGSYGRIVDAVEKAAAQAKGGAR